MADMHRVGLTGCIRLALQEIGYDTLAAFRHIGHGAADQRRVGQAEMGRVAFGHRGFLANFCPALRATPISGYPYHRQGRMSEHRETTGTKAQPKWRSRGNQAQLCALLALMLAGCSTEPGQAVAKFWDRAWGPANEGRPAPPGAGVPFPNLGTVPPRPEIPDMATREALAAGLVQERDASREPLGALPGSAPRGAPPPPALAPALAGMAIPAPAIAAPAAPSAPQQAAPAPVAAPEPAGIPAPPALAPAGPPPPPVLREAPRRP
jgi:hypothetical protein